MADRLLSKGGVKRFQDFISGMFVYVDKTYVLWDLARNYESYILTRPRRMGKSTFLSSLEYLFAHGTKGTDGLACHDLWDDPYRYYVLKFDFSSLKSNSLEKFNYQFVDALKDYSKFFGIELDLSRPIGSLFKDFVNGCLQRLSDPEFLKTYEANTQGDRPVCPDRIVLLIDEYDAPLTNSLDNPELFDEIRAQYQLLFGDIKALTCFRFVFLTGVSSYAQTSIFSGTNQFINISLDSRFATCCGYTEDEIKRYFAPELKRVQNNLGLTQAQLLEQMHYYYDGYLFSDSFSEADKVFNPVSVTLFLSDFSPKFRNYWSHTGANESFLTSLLKNTEPHKALDVLKMLVPKFNELPADQKDQLVGFINSLVPAVCLSTFDRGDNNSFGSLIEMDIDELTVKLDNVEEITSSNAVQILFQAGYLSIKGFDDDIAKLGFANHEVKSYLIKKLCKHYNELFKDSSAIGTLLNELFKNGEQVLSDFRKGGQQVAKQINNMLNIAPAEFYTDSQKELAYTFIVNLCLSFACIKAKQEIMYCEGRSDLVIYREEHGPLVEDVIIEFKVAREKDNVFTKLKEGSEQIITQKYGISFFNSNPIRYCVVISPGLPGVAAVSKVESGKEPVIEYVAERVIPQTGKIIPKDEYQP